MDEPLTGGCLCGGVRFAIDAPLLSASYCHCKRCQRRTGCGASAQAYPPRGAVTIVAGQDLLTEYRPEGGGFTKVFCSVCGGHVFSHNPDDRDEISVRLGAFDGDPGIRPQRRQWTESAAAWEPIPDDGLPRFAQSSRGVA
jgi:hypothetical protein